MVTTQLLVTILVKFPSAVSEIQRSKVTAFPLTMPIGLTTVFPLPWEPVILLQTI